ncbi:hypothetical protein AWB74_00956 [Caballeronia arvi]|uniref:Uncharacterized protein n=1 Tax=Caballeronia arvi TaxID=1777135 RepID=A0A158FUF7_9BURK|nr:hypothetical protein [Caballeronia arvi]SAL23496.1 hypothetical protein AWB74_00956 [Caballeronia arvi]
MNNTKEQINDHLSVLHGFDVSGVHHAGDMLTLQFGPLREVTTRRGTVKRVGAWALHIQCDWRIEQGSTLFASYSDFAASDESTDRITRQIRDLLIGQGSTGIEEVEAGDGGDVCLSLSRGVRLLVRANGIPGDEDWRLFPSDPDAPHFVIEGGKVDTGAD